MFLTVYLTSVNGQTEIPLKTTWIKEDVYGRKYDTKIPKERYKTNSNGEIEGLYILYFEDGKTIKQKTTYSNGIINGPDIIYSEYTGNIIMKTTYKNGIKNGPFIQGLFSGNYKNGQLDGELAAEFSDGSVKIENYIQGVIVGKSILYSDKSRTKILSSTEYQNGVENGKHITYFEDGTIKEEGNYSNGKKTGLWVEYDRDCFLDKFIYLRGNYINGNRDGEWVNLGKYKHGCFDNQLGLGPKMGYHAKFNNGEYIEDFIVDDSGIKYQRLEFQLDSIDKAYKKNTEDRQKAYEQKRDSTKMAKEKAEKDYIQMINDVKSKPYTETERDFAGNWEFKSEKIYTKDEILIFFEEFKVNTDRTYTYKSYFKKWLENPVYKEYTEKGNWEIKDNTFYAYINEENGQPSKRIDPLKFDEISKKKASRTVQLFIDTPSVKVNGKKVSE